MSSLVTFLSQISSLDPIHLSTFLESQRTSLSRAEAELARELTSFTGHGLEVIQGYEIETLKSLAKNGNELKDSIRDEIEKAEVSMKTVKELRAGLVQQQMTTVYLNLQKLVEQKSKEAKMALDNSTLQALPLFLDLVGLYSKLDTIRHNSSKSPCLNLCVTLGQRIAYLFERLSTLVEAQLRNCIESVAWPLISSHGTSQNSIKYSAFLSSGTPSEIEKRNKNVSDFLILCSHLLTLQSMSETIVPIKSSFMKEIKICSVDRRSFDETFTEQFSSIVVMCYKSLSFDFQPSCWLVQYLIEPILIRFNFHFNSNRATNRDTKPEWWISFIYSAIMDHVSFLEESLDSLSSFEISKQFILGMFGILQGKLVELLNHDSDSLFRHVLDEILAFITSLSEFNFNAEVLVELFNPKVLSRMIKVDLDYCIDRVNAIIDLKDKGWNLLAFKTEEHISNASTATFYNAGENCHTLLILLDSLTQRWKLLSFAYICLHYVETIEVVAVEKYLDFSKQSLESNYEIIRSDIYSISTEDGKPVWIESLCILNSLQHLIFTLRSWNLNILYMKIGYIKTTTLPLTTRLKDLDSNLSFQNSSKDYGFWNQSIQPISELLDYHISIIVGSLVLFFSKCMESYVRFGHMSTSFAFVDDDIGNEPLDYLEDIFRSVTAIDNSPHGWSTFISSNVVGGTRVSGSFCETLSILQAQLHLIRQHLHPTLCNIVWTRSAVKLDSVLFEQLVVNKNFSVSGRAQFCVDMAALFALFVCFTEVPQNFFKHIRDTLIIFKWRNGVVKYVRESENADEIVLAAGITKLSVGEVMSICANIIVE